MVARDYETGGGTSQVCAKEARCSKEPMIASQLPDYPWQKVGSDLFESGGSTFLLVVDYFSRFVEISKLTTTSSISVITALNICKVWDA